MRAMAAAELVEPGSAEWYETISASKVPELMGLSSFRSPFELHHVMVGRLEARDAGDDAKRGHYIERALLDWWADEHPEHAVGPTGTWVHPDNPSWTATPDGTWGDALLECKAMRKFWEWGRPGTAEIPPDKLVQVAWQMWVTGSRTVYVLVDLMAAFQVYVVRWEDVEDDFHAYVLPAVLDFQEGLRTGQAPDMDGSDSTYQAVRRLHPELADWAVTLDEETSVAYARAIVEEKRAKAEALRMKAEVTARADTARKILAHDGKTQLAFRSGRKGSTPSLTSTAGVEKILTLTPQQ